MTVCPQCGYERTAKDNGFVGAEECPKCGIIYKKWKPDPDAGKMKSVLENSGASDIHKEKKPISYKSVIVSAIIIILVIIFAKYTFFTKNEASRPDNTPPQQIVSTLPVIPPRGMESGSWLIRTAGQQGTITAAGQIFTPLHHAPVLIKLGFLFTQYSLEERVRGFKLQVILSEWNETHPTPKALWISEPTSLPAINGNFQADWVDFDVPYVLLNPAKQYIAWVTLSGLSNQYDASVGIPGMGPRFSTIPSEEERKLASANSPYPEGRRASYKQGNPDGDLSPMTDSEWEVDNPGHNLHFRMSFMNWRNISSGKAK